MFLLLLLLLLRFIFCYYCSSNSHPCYFVTTITVIFQFTANIVVTRISISIIIGIVIVLSIIVVITINSIVVTSLNPKLHRIHHPQS